MSVKFEFWVSVFFWISPSFPPQRNFWCYSSLSAGNAQDPQGRRMAVDIISARTIPDNTSQCHEEYSPYCFSDYTKTLIWHYQYGFFWIPVPSIAMVSGIRWSRTTHFFPRISLWFRFYIIPLYLKTSCFAHLKLVCLFLNQLIWNVIVTGGHNH